MSKCSSTIPQNDKQHRQVLLGRWPAVMESRDRSPGREKLGIAWWADAVVDCGWNILFVLPCCATYFNRSRIRNFALSNIMSPSPPPSALDLARSLAAQSLMARSSGAVSGNGNYHNVLRRQGNHEYPYSTHPISWAPYYATRGIPREVCGCVVRNFSLHRTFACNCPIRSGIFLQFI